MENEKKYEGTVNITSAEYRELVTEAVTAKAEASEQRSAKWKLESEVSKLKAEIEELRKSLEAAEAHIAEYKASLRSTMMYPMNPCTTNAYNGGNFNG